jgi:hypothetical protein
MADARHAAHALGSARSPVHGGGGLSCGTRAGTGSPPPPLPPPCHPVSSDLVAIVQLLTPGPRCGEVPEYDALPTVPHGRAPSLHLQASPVIGCSSPSPVSTPAHIGGGDPPGIGQCHAGRASVPPRVALDAARPYGEIHAGGVPITPHLHPNHRRLPHRRGSSNVASASSFGSSPALHPWTRWRQSWRTH